MRRIAQADAQARFLRAIDALSNLDGSPLARLSDYYREWKAAFSNPDSRYVSVKQREEAERKARGVLERWTAACKLFEAGSGAPPRWILDHADSFLKTYEESQRSAVTHPADDLAARFLPKDASPEVVPAKRGALWLPMEFPKSLPGEPWLKYKARVCEPLRKRWEIEQKAYETLAHASVQAAAPSELDTTNLDHSEWFILYQCCRWALNKIATSHRRYKIPVGTVWQGILSVAKRTGLELTFKRPALKKSVR